MTPPEPPEDDDVQLLRALAPMLRKRQATVRVLGGGLTNRNYRIDLDAESYVMRIPGKDSGELIIDRASEAAAARAAARAGVAPEVVDYSGDERNQFLVTRFARGRQLTPEDVHQPEILGRVARTLRCYHASPPPEGVVSFSPFEAVRRYHHLAREKAVAMPAVIGRALDLLGGVEQELQPGEPPCLCHNDLLPANFLEEGSVLRVIDWEYAGVGDRFFDLGNFAANSLLGGDEERRLLEGYFGEARPEHLRRLRLMRQVSDLREATWSYVQAKLSQLESPSFYLERADRYLAEFLTAATRGEPAAS